MIVITLPLPQVGFPGRLMCRMFNGECFHDTRLCGERPQAGRGTGRTGLDRSHRTSADSFRVVPMGDGKRLFLPAASTSIWTQTVFGENVTLGNEIFFRLGNFWKGLVAESHQLITAQAWEGNPSFSYERASEWSSTESMTATRKLFLGKALDRQVSVNYSAKWSCWTNGHCFLCAIHSWKCDGKCPFPRHIRSHAKIWKQLQAIDGSIWFDRSLWTSG